VIFKWEEAPGVLFGKRAAEKGAKKGKPNTDDMKEPSWIKERSG